jgi:murein L,D-transpeptidase YafK
MPTKIGGKNEQYNDEAVKLVYDQLHKWDGAINEVAKRCDLHRESVRLTLLGKAKRSLPLVMEKAAEVLKEYNLRHRKTMEAIKEAASII